jgi:hypothetical protein
MAVVRAKCSPSRENHAATGPSKATVIWPLRLMLIAVRRGETKPLWTLEERPALRPNADAKPSSFWGKLPI